MTILKAGFIASLPAICGFIGGVLGGVISDYLLRRGLKEATIRAYFADIWLIGDYSGENGNGYIAIRLINALNTGGLQITTQNKAKGQFAFEFTGHDSIKNPEIVPYELYIKQEIGA